MGLHKAWPEAEIEGMDIKPQPRYPFNFKQGDALDILPTLKNGDYAFIWSSPPCQAYTCLKTAWNAREHVGIVEWVRSYLSELKTPWVIENVPGAPLYHPLIILCGTMFGLKTSQGHELRRHRVFQLNFPVGLVPPCNHQSGVVGVYGGHARDRRRTVTVTSKGGGYNAKSGRPSLGIKAAREAMGIDWMNSYELSQAIPPAYSEYIARQVPIIEAAA